ncbi:MAG: hypothetical protein Q9187_002774 [Circinaria calcarea]
MDILNLCSPQTDDDLMSTYTSYPSDYFRFPDPFDDEPFGAPEDTADPLEPFIFDFDSDFGTALSTNENSASPANEGGSTSSVKVATHPAKQVQPSTQMDTTQLSNTKIMALFNTEATTHPTTEQMQPSASGNTAQPLDAKSAKPSSADIATDFTAEQVQPDAPMDNIRPSNTEAAEPSNAQSTTQLTLQQVQLPAPVDDVRLSNSEVAEPPSTDAPTHLITIERAEQPILVDAQPPDVEVSLSPLVESTMLPRSTKATQQNDEEISQLSDVSVDPQAAVESATLSTTADIDEPPGTTESIPSSIDGKAKSPSINTALPPFSTQSSITNNAMQPSSPEGNLAIEGSPVDNPINIDDILSSTSSDRSKFSKLSDSSSETTEFPCRPIRKRRRDPNQTGSRYPRRKRAKPNREGFVTFQRIATLEIVLEMCKEAGIPEDEFADVMAVGLIHYNSQ